jgi:Zn-dependent hydrolases, including glyoxylases
MTAAPVLDPDADDLHAVAIRFATRVASKRNEHFYRGHTCADEAKPIDYFVWVVAGRGTAVLVDSGFTAEVAAERGNREHAGSPLDVAARLGVARDRIEHLVLTHLHYDHTGYADQVPDARLWLQRAEWEYWHSAHAQRGENPHLIEPRDLAALESRVVRDGLLEGDAEIVPGVRVHRTGGHTAGLQVVAVDTAGGPLVLASDASHFYDNIGDDRPYSIVDHLPSMYDAFDWIRSTAGSPARIVPGHDPDVLTRFPAPDAFAGLVAHLA